jgi:hypothetical protein
MAILQLVNLGGKRTASRRKKKGLCYEMLTEGFGLDGTVERPQQRKIDKTFWNLDRQKSLRPKLVLLYTVKWIFKQGVKVWTGFMRLRTGNSEYSMPNGTMDVSYDFLNSRQTNRFARKTLLKRVG